MFLTYLYHPNFSEFPETCPIRDINGWREVGELELDVEIGSMAHDSASFDCTHVVVAACLCIYIYTCIYRLVPASGTTCGGGGWGGVGWGGMLTFM